MYFVNAFSLEKGALSWIQMKIALKYRMRAPGCDFFAEDLVILRILISISQGRPPRQHKSDAAHA